MMLEYTETPWSGNSITSDKCRKIDFNHQVKQPLLSGGESLPENHYICVPAHKTFWSCHFLMD